MELAFEVISIWLPGAMSRKLSFGSTDTEVIVPVTVELV